MKPEEVALFSHLVARPEAELDLVRAALLIAEPEYAELDVASYVEELDRLGAVAAQRIAAAPQRPALANVIRYLYEELGLLEPRARSEGGFRMYGPEAVDRIHWIVKLQAIGFTLAEIQGFVGDFQGAGSGREATARVRALFTEKQSRIREQIMQLQVIENDLSEALTYLDSCQTCTDEYAPAACGATSRQ